VTPLASWLVKGNAVTEFDYIVVGGGTAGWVVAARLSQDTGGRMLLLEAGARGGLGP
jgi:choline dehydrogenase-like flavoprotein